MLVIAYGFSRQNYSQYNMVTWIPAGLRVLIWVSSWPTAWLRMLPKDLKL